MNGDEDAALRADATQRLRELRIRYAALASDADDSFVLSELTTLASEISSCVEALRR